MKGWTALAIIVLLVVSVSAQQVNQPVIKCPEDKLPVLQSGAWTCQNKVTPAKSLENNMWLGYVAVFLMFIAGLYTAGLVGRKTVDIYETRAKSVGSMVQGPGFRGRITGVRRDPNMPQTQNRFLKISTLAQPLYAPVGILSPEASDDQLCADSSELYLYTADPWGNIRPEVVEKAAAFMAGAPSSVHQFKSMAQATDALNTRVAGLESEVQRSSIAGEQYFKKSIEEHKQLKELAPTSPLEQMLAMKMAKGGMPDF